MSELSDKDKLFLLSWSIAMLNNPHMTGIDKKFTQDEIDSELETLHRDMNEILEKDK